MKSISRIAVGISLFVAFAALAWVMSSGGLQAQGLGPEEQPDGFTVQVSEPVTAKISRPVRDLPTDLERVIDREINPIKNPGIFRDDLGMTGTNTHILDALAGKGVGEGRTPAPLFTFEGQGEFGAVTPPDTNGDVGPNHYVQMVNLSFAIYDKAGNLLVGPLNNNTLWSGFGGPCETDNSGDPVVLYDDMADRWMLSQFAVSSGQSMCVAVSTTPDPTGSYYLYEFPMPDFPDYPKFGIWPDGYYLGTNTGFPNQYYAHVFDRVAMLSGAPAGHQYVGSLPNFPMPADADGQTPPPPGAPGTFYTHLKNGYPDHPAGPDRLALYEFAVDWVTPANTTFNLVTELPISAFNYTVCGFFAGDCIPQPDTTQRLDSVSPWPMVRLQYRNFNSYETLVGNFTVDVDGSDWAGIRWFELRRSGPTPWSLYQEGTFAPDADHRWMGSIAMDGSGNIALGYSVSSDTTYPSLRYATRLRSDPLGVLQPEMTLYPGGGSQTGPYDRWGDYSAMSVDPVDNCTFWYTNEYHNVSDTSFNWNTRIGTFRIPECTGTLGPDFAISAAPESIAVCAPDDAVYDITVDYLSGFTGSVDLSAANVPVGTVATIAPSTVVTPTTSSVMTLTVGATTPGSYNVDIVGVSVPTPTHTTTVGIDVYDAIPGTIVLTSPADGATGVDLLPTLSWTADAQGDVYWVEVATDMAFTNIVFSDTVQADSVTLDTSLAPLTQYYWRVYSSNVCGDGAWSAVWNFTTRDIPPILVVDDDDNGPDVRAYYTDALDALGAEYDVWDTGNSDNEPSAAELAPYSTVIWFTGDEFGGFAGPGATGEADLSTWLDNGNCLFISSQDYYWDRGQTTFMTDYLGLSSATSDDGGYASVTGQNIVFGGLGPYSLSYPFSDFADVVNPDGTAELAFLGDNSNNAAIDKDSGVYRTSFWGFPFEAIANTADREEVMGTVLDWCGNGAATGTLDGTVTDAASGAGIDGATVTVTGGANPRTTTTDANGDYSIVMGVGSYDVTVEAVNYISETVSAVSIITDTTTTVDFALDVIMSVNPDEFEVSVLLGNTLTTSLEIINAGTMSATFSLSEMDGGYAAAQPVPSYVPPAASAAPSQSLSQFASADVSGSSAMTGAAPNQNILIDQPPNQSNGIFSDEGCDICTSGVQVVADNFVLSSPTAIGQIVFWSGYYSTDTPIDPDAITVIFHEDASGLPGTAVYTETDVAYSRVQTGVTLFGVSEWMHTLTLASPVALGPGNYWVELYNNTGFGTDDFFWETGDLDATNGLAGSAWATVAPGSAWNFDAATDMAFQLVEAEADIPWLSENPITGTVDAASSTFVDLVFDASVVTQTGTYTGTLQVSVDDPAVTFEIPVTMHVIDDYVYIYLPVLMKP